MKRVSYKQRGDDSFMIEIKAKPSRAKEFRFKTRIKIWFYKNLETSQRRINFTSFNHQEGEE
jgi:hypothetical protein